jgi:predicted aspartyl protease
MMKGPTGPSLLNQARLSRRQLIGYSAAAASLLPASAAMAEAPASKPPDAVDAAQVQDKVATGKDIAHHMTVDVMINDQGPFRFVVDTGADRTVLADDVAVTLGLVRGRNVLVQGILRSMMSQTVPIRSFAVGKLVREDLTTPVLPRALLLADGYLGLDVIDGTRVSFDFKNQDLEVLEPHSEMGSEMVRPYETLVPVSGRMGHLRSVDCAVQGVMATAFVDTGAEVSVANPNLYKQLIDSGEVSMIAGTIPITGVTGGVMQGDVAAVNKIRLKDLHFADCTLVIADLQIFDIWGLSDQPALLIGMNYLRQFSRVTIDYGLKELRFDFASLTNVAEAWQRA